MSSVLLPAMGSLRIGSFGKIWNEIWKMAPWLSFQSSLQLCNATHRPYNTGSIHSSKAHRGTSLTKRQHCSFTSSSSTSLEVAPAVPQTHRCPANSCALSNHPSPKEVDHSCYAVLSTDKTSVISSMACPALATAACRLCDTSPPVQVTGPYSHCTAF